MSRGSRSGGTQSIKCQKSPQSMFLVHTFSRDAASLGGKAAASTATHSSRSLMVSCRMYVSACAMIIAKDRLYLEVKFADDRMGG